MTQQVHQALATAVLRLLRPLVRVLLRHGMAYGSFAELARKAFAEEGFDHIARSGKRASASSVAALTGLTRREAKRLQDADEADFDAAGYRHNRAVRAVSGWISDAKYLDDAGEPAVLPMEGDAGSFSALVREFCGDIPPAAMIAVLQAAGTVTVIDGEVKLRKRAYLPLATPVDRIHILGTDVAELIDSIGHNLEASPDDLFFQRKVYNFTVRNDALAAFRELSGAESQALLERYHQWLKEHQADRQAIDNGESAYVAVGIYYLEKPGEESAQ